jgi:hypothetical protein
MNIKRYPPHITKDVENIWNSLQKQISVSSITSDWIWVKTWLETYSDLVPAEFFVGMQKSVPCGIALVAKQVGRTLPFPVVSYQIGTAGEPIKDRIHMLGNTVLSPPEHKEEFINLLTKKIFTLLSPEELTLEFFNEEDIRYFNNAGERLGIKYNNTEEEAYSFKQENNQKDNHLIESFSSGTRYKIRRSLKELGKVETETANNLNQAEDIFRELKKLHQLTWEKRGKRGMFASRRYEKFHRKMIKHYLDQGKVMLFRIKSEKLGTVGCVYLFVQNDVALMYQSGFNDFANIKGVNSGRIKHGLVCHYLCMRECFKKGMKEYNFGPAEYRYKQELTNSRNIIYSLSLRRSIKPYIRDRLWNTYIKAENNSLAKPFIQPLYTLYKQLT